MNSISVSQALYALMFMLILCAAAWNLYKYPNSLKQITTELLSVFSVFLLLYSLNTWIGTDPSLSLKNIQATSPKQPSKEVSVSGSGTKYAPLEPMAFSQLGVQKSQASTEMSIFWTIIFVLVIGYAFWRYAKAGLRIERYRYLLALRATRNLKGDK